MRSSAMWGETMPVKSADKLGMFISLRRRALRLTQQKIADVTGIERVVVSRLERGRGDTTELRVVLLVVNALGLDIELRPRGSKFTPRPPTNVTELGLSADALAALREAGIQEVAQLGSASDLIQRPEFSKGAELYEVACALNRYGLSLRRGHIPGDREREMFRLRIVEGLTLKEVGERVGVKTERARQLLSDFFGLTGTPPAARRSTRI